MDGQRWSPEVLAGDGGKLDVLDGRMGCGKKKVVYTPQKLKILELLSLFTVKTITKSNFLKQKQERNLPNKM